MKINILDLGCGNNKYRSESSKDKVIGIDHNNDVQADVVQNLNEFPYPFSDNEFDMVICTHILEHLDDTIKVMEELWRIAKSNAVIKINTPNFAHITSFSDPTHKHHFTYHSFDYFDKSTYYGDDFGFYTTVDFKIVMRGMSFTKPYKILGIEFFANTRSEEHTSELQSH